MTQIALTVADAGRDCQRALIGEPRPRLLVAFPFWPVYLAHRSGGIQFRDYLLDSGAYSVRNSGKEVRLADYIAFALERARDPLCAGIFALDAIGDWEGTRRNYEAMRAAGLPVIPTFHIGEPWEALEAYRDSPTLALGGMVAGANPRIQKHARTAAVRRGWIDQCFARAWPRWIHGFGVKDPGILRSVPFASVDTANWFTDPYGWGKWRSLPFRERGQAAAPRRRSLSTLRLEVEWYLRLERELMQQWAAALAAAPGLPPLRPVGAVA